MGKWHTFGSRRVRLAVLQEVKDISTLKTTPIMDNENYIKELPAVGSRWYKQTESGIKCCTVIKCESGRAITDIGIALYAGYNGDWQNSASPLAHAYEFKKLMDYVRANIHTVTDQRQLEMVKYFIDCPA